MNTFSIFALLIILFLLLGIWVLYIKINKLKKEKKEIGMTEGERNLEGRREKLVSYLEKNQRITNNEAQELFGVSDATATRYLQQFEDENLIEQKGQTGNAVYYELK